jgi:DNA (cytosine-5)-methyltransferase 1
MFESIAAIDLFCGAGGLTHGFEQAGLPVVAGYDIDPCCEFPYKHNNKAEFLFKSIEEVSGGELESLLESFKIKALVGCAPCQPFSTYSRRYKGNNSKWKLLNNFSELIQKLQPEIVSMENVVQLRNHKVFIEFTRNLEVLGYSYKAYEVNCLSYGIPQTRQRLVLLASRFGEIELIPPTHTDETYRTVYETIGHLEPLEAGQASKSDPLHQCCKLSELNLRRIHASKPGGTWRDWPKELVAKCHTKTSGKTYPGVYGRMEWHKPSPTITTQCFGFGNGRFGHPEQNRAISLREAALLQTFPESYQFVAPNDEIMFKRVGRLIGNAVPVVLGKVIAQSILNHVSLYSKSSASPESKYSC